jgi:hypothetical protein
MKLFKARLRPSLPHLAGEAPASFVSRLAQLHRSCPSMRWKFGVELERPSVRRPEVELL